QLVSDPSQADGKHTFLTSKAVLNGYKKISPDNAYLYAVPDKGHRIRGYLIHALPPECLPALKAYEGRNYSRRVLRVQTSEGPEEALVFVGNEKKLKDAFGSFGTDFHDPLKQEILLEKKIDAAIREVEKEQLHTNEQLTRQAVAELIGATLRDLIRQHFDRGGISDYTIRHSLRSTPIHDYDRLCKDPSVAPFATHYLRMVIRQVIFNQFEERIHREFRYELDHLPDSGIMYERIISSLVALRILNRNKTVLNVITADTLGDLDFSTHQLVDFVRRAVAAAEVLYDSKPIKTQINFVRGHMGAGYIPLGAELEFSNIGHDVILDHKPNARQDPNYDGFLYFYDFGLDVLTWKLGGHIDDHREKAPGKPRRGFFEVALGNLSIEANISKPITRDPWILNQLIQQTMRFYEIRPHSIHMSMQLRSRHRPDRDRLLPLFVMQCLFAIAGNPVRAKNGSVRIQRLASEEIVRRHPAPHMFFSEISKRFSAHSGEAHLPGSRDQEGRYVQQFRFLRLSRNFNYEPIAMALKGIQLSLRPGSFLTPMQYESSRRHRVFFEELLQWGQHPTPISLQNIDRFLTHVQKGLMTERRGSPAHSKAYIAWSLSQLQKMLDRYNSQVAS
ncbi:MAG: gamma-glutamylcyclotransferase, partial [Candidatus Hydrogenedentes bacterium]|nr:gamma-glutamylcyclotransferase [Candidatus Hydrogenedentota bacterium]